MGQYHVTVNLDKKQYLMPHKLGDGLKLLEQAGSSGGVSDALLLLLAVSNGRGGGDVVDYPDEQRMNYRESTIPEIIGSWGGDRIAVIGDYAEPTDLPAEFRAELIYGMCRDWDDKEDADLDSLREWWEAPGRRWTGQKNEQGEYIYEEEGSLAEKHGMTFEEYVAEARTWRDISGDILPVLERHLGVKLFGDGWKTRVTMCWEHPDKAKGHWDHVDTRDPFIVNRPPKMSSSEVDLMLRMKVPPEVIGIDAVEAATRNNGWGNRR